MTRLLVRLVEGFPSPAAIVLPTWGFRCAHSASLNGDTLTVVSTGAKEDGHKTESQVTEGKCAVQNNARCMLGEVIHETCSEQLRIMTRARCSLACDSSE